MSKLKIVTKNGETNVYINGKLLPELHGIHFTVDVNDKVPTVTFVTEFEDVKIESDDFVTENKKTRPKPIPIIGCY